MAENTTQDKKQTEEPKKKASAHPSGHLKSDKTRIDRLSEKLRANLKRRKK